MEEVTRSSYFVVWTCSCSVGTLGRHIMLKFFLVYCSIVPDGLVVTLSCCPIMVHVFKNDAALRNVFSGLAFAAQLCRKSEGFFSKSEGFFSKSEGFFGWCGRLLPILRKASSDVAECFFWRSLLKMQTASKFRIFGRSGTAAHVRTYIIVHTYTCDPSRQLCLSILNSELSPWRKGASLTMRW